jgi:hypothetical protein
MFPQTYNKVVATLEETSGFKGQGEEPKKQTKGQGEKGFIYMRMLISI